MPPSGYKPTEADSVVSFLESICESLITEGIEKKLSPTDALKNECENIQSIENSGCEIYQAGTLLLTRQLYAQLLSSNPKNYEELRKERDKQLCIVKENILSIHVPSI